MDDDFRTPRWLVRGAERIVGGPFGCDVCATAWSAQAPEWITREQNSLQQEWSNWGRCWCNPPWTVASMRAFAWKAIDEAHRGATVALLMPTWARYGWYQALKRNGRFHDVIGTVVFAKADGTSIKINYGFGNTQFLTLICLGPGVVKRSNGDPIIKPKKLRCHG
jgi:hypothetical protein